MEIIIIIIGSTLIPIVIIVGLVFVRKKVDADRKKFDSLRKSNEELINTLEELVDAKSEQIKNFL